MGRKRNKPDEALENGVPDNGTAVTDLPVDVPALEQRQGVRDAPGGGPAARPTPPNRPAASFAAHSDRTTRIEVAVWSKQVKVGEEEYTQYSLTLSRSWRDREGSWQGNASFRVHDVPVLLYLVGQAYHWCVAQRTSVKIGDEPLPF